MKKLSVLWILFFLTGCDLSTTARDATERTEETQLYQDLYIPTLSEEGGAAAANILKENIQFPIWWVQKSFEQGNSPKVIVFFSDGRIYGRKTQGKKLNPLGIWTYDPTYRRVFISLGADEDLVLSTHSDGSWDGKILFQQVELTPGSADFRGENIVGKYCSDLKNPENIYRNFYYTTSRNKVMSTYGINLLSDGTLKFAGIVKGNVQDLQFLWNLDKEYPTFKWRITPLGDAVEIYDAPDPYQSVILEAEYNGYDSGAPIIIRASSHTNIPVYHQVNSKSNMQNLKAVENFGGQAFMTLLE